MERNKIQFQRLERCIPFPYKPGIAMDDFSNNRKYALAWVLLAVLFAFALHVNVVIRQGAFPKGAVEGPVGKVK